MPVCGTYTIAVSSAHRQTVLEPCFPRPCDKPRTGVRWDRYCWFNAIGWMVLKWCQISNFLSLHNIHPTMWPMVCFSFEVLRKVSSAFVILFCSTFWPILIWICFSPYYMYIVYYTFQNLWDLSVFVKWMHCILFMRSLGKFNQSKAINKTFRSLSTVYAPQPKVIDSPVHGKNCIPLSFCSTRSL